MNPLPAILAANYIALSAAVAQVATVATHWVLSHDMIAHRVSTIRERKISGVSAEYPDIVDTVDIKLRNEVAWSRDHTVRGSWVEIYGTISTRDSARLMVFDAHLKAGQLWVLYTVDQRVTLDYLTKTDDAAFVLQKESLVIKQHNSGVNPYLIESGAVFIADDIVHVGLRVHGTTASLRKDKSPYDFFAIRDGRLAQITDDDELWRLRVEHSHKLDDEDRPTLTKQIRRPEQTAEQPDEPPADSPDDPASSDK